MTFHQTLHSHSDSTRCHLIRHLWQSDAGLDLSKLDIGGLVAGVLSQDP